MVMAIWYVLMGEESWIYGTKLAPILEQGTLQLKMLQGKGQCIFAYFIELLMFTLVLVGGVMVFVVEALV
ncbi:transmembrane protein, putative [Medicago truncatula]|uniref:Transmembrane protein, putative n=1 Tax=Medicago truncatula TaxID=3880 RepID=A0A072TM65_MEDTR|nr:transmembrane protein, putative [Medicago truncatula]